MLTSSTLRGAVSRAAQEMGAEAQRAAENIAKTGEEFAENLSARNEAFTRHTHDILEKIIAGDCVEVTPEYHKKSRNLFNQFYRWFSYQFIRVALFLFTFYFKKER